MFKKLFPALAILALCSFSAMAADTDVTAAVSDVSTLWTSIKVIAIGVVLFLIGRKLLRKV